MDEEKKTIAPTINALLDKVKEKNSLKNDQALAHALGVSFLSIWRWRRGEMSPSARKLVPLALEFATEINAQPLDKNA